MNKFFYDNPMKAFVKCFFLILTYFGSILFKQFSIAIVFPTIFIYFLSNIQDYGEIAFNRKDKSKKIRDFAMFITIAYAFVSAAAYAIFNSDNVTVSTFLNQNYWIIYIICSIVWIIPLQDGIRSQLNKIRLEAQKTTKKLESDIAFNVMAEHFEDNLSCLQNS